VEKAEGIYRYLCSGSTGLNSAFLEDLLRPLNDGGSAYQLKMLNYFRVVLEKSKNPDEADTVLDTYPDYWNQDEESKELKIRAVCSRMLRAVDELWEYSKDAEVRNLIVRIRFGEYSNKRELLEHIRTITDESISDSAREKLASMLRCFLLPTEEDLLKLQASQLLLFKIGDSISRLAALEYLASYLENKNLNYAEKGSIASVIESLLTEKHLGERVREKAQYLLFIADPGRLKSEDEQKSVLVYLRGIVEGEGFSGENTEKRVLDSLVALSGMPTTGETRKKAIQYLEFKIKNPKATPTWDKLEKAKPFLQG
jgi:hypothetical protein